MPEPDIDFYAVPGPTSDVARHADHIDDLPSDPNALGGIVRGLLLHNLAAEMDGIAPSPDRNGMTIFGAGPTLDRVLALDPTPLGHERPEGERLIGFCYHFALVQCALLRTKGVPARARCGFASYLIDGKWTDHWVVEHWAKGRWQRNDPQIGLDDLSDDDFHDAVHAWQLCRSGEANPADHGNGQYWGWDELRGSLVNDIGALNKIEIGDWDWCQLLDVDPRDRPHPHIDEQLDTFADLAARGQPLADLNAAFLAATTIRPPTKLMFSPLPDGTR